MAIEFGSGFFQRVASKMAEEADLRSELDQYKTDKSGSSGGIACWKSCEK